MNLSKISVLFLSLFIITFPASVTISQTFAILGTLFFIFDSLNKKKLFKKFGYPIFFMGVTIYLSLLISYIFHIKTYSEIYYPLFRGEISDFWFCIVFLAAGFLSRDRENLLYFKNAYFISLAIVIVSGVISMFTPFRLSSYIVHGFTVPQGERLQHYAGDLFGIKTYLPIGLMNTHLTYGGILGLFYPGLIAYYIYKFPDRTELKNIFYSIIIFILSILVFYNQSRSVWIGIIYASFVMIWKWRDYIREFINKERMIYLLILFMIISISGIYFIQKNWLIKRAISDSFESSTTENQRYYIFKNTISIILDSPILGVGPGNFYNAHAEKSNEMARNHQELWYDLYITPRGHAHNDLLHLFAIGGIISAFAYLIFWFLNIRFFLEAEEERDSVLFSGFLIFFPAGFFQCYFLDDEVALPFFVFLGIFCGRVISISEVQKEKEKILKLLQQRKSRAGLVFQVEALSIKNAIDTLTFYFRQSNNHDNPEKKKGILRESILILFIPLLLMIVYIIQITVIPADQIYNRRLKSDSLENLISFYQSLKGIQSKIKKENFNIPVKLEGCLTHLLGEKPIIRNFPFSFILNLPENLKNPPQSVKIQVISRDSFDQDKFYKVHSEKVIYEEEKELKTGANIFKFDNIYSSEESIKIPENIYFRDFNLLFTPNDPNQLEMDLPIIKISKLCDNSM